MICEKCAHLYIDRNELARLINIPGAKRYTTLRCELVKCKFKRRFLSIMKK